MIAVNTGKNYDSVVVNVYFLAAVVKVFLPYAADGFLYLVSSLKKLTTVTHSAVSHNRFYTIY